MADGHQPPSGDPSSRLCTSCGLCCDGSLFRNGPLDKEEAADAAALGLRVVAGEQSRFLLPCPRLKDCVCTVYQNRPRVCRAYRCALLKGLEAGRIGLDEALHIVAEGRRLSAEARAVLIHRDVRVAVESLDRPLQELASELGVDSRELAVERLRALALHRFLHRHFHTTVSQAPPEATPGSA